MRHFAVILTIGLLSGFVIAQQAPSSKLQRSTAREQAIQSATTAAGANLREQVLETSLGENLRVSDLVSRREDADHLDTILRSAQTVGGTRWISEDICQVRLELPATKVADFLIGIVDAADHTPSAYCDRVHSAVRGWQHARFCAGGSSQPASVAGATTKPVSTQPVSTVASNNPSWIDQQLQAHASADGDGSRLKLARVAEAKATTDLREQLLALQLDPQHTLREARASDPQLQKAIDRSMLQAKTCHVDYLPNGSVRVQVTLDLKDVWQQLHSTAIQH